MTSNVTCIVYVNTVKNLTENKLKTNAATIIEV